MIDFDANATTTILPEALAAMQPIWQEFSGNPSSSHGIGRKARQRLDEAKEKIAACLDAKSEEIILTSGATESNNLAIHGLIHSVIPNSLAAGVNHNSTHIVTTMIEHPCVVEPVKYLEKRGFAVSRVMPDANGEINSDTFSKAVREETKLAAIMLANHETGAVNPVAELSKRHPKVHFHCDAAQAVGKIPVSFRALHVTSLSVSGHKFCGPKGIGLLLLKSGSKLNSQMQGGPQQSGFRPGTEPVPLAVGLAVALEHACKNMQINQQNWQKCADLLWAGIHDLAVLNGPSLNHSPRLANSINASFTGCRADLLLMSLDMNGLACSIGSACASGALQTSPVLAAMGIEGDRLRSAIRFSFPPGIHETEIANAIKIIRKGVSDVRMK